MLQTVAESFSVTMVLSVLVCARITGLVMSMPSLLRAISWRMRAVLVIAISAIVVPNLSEHALSTDLSSADLTEPQFLIELVIGVGRELVFGMIIGGVVQFLVTGIQLAGELIMSVAGFPILPSGGDSDASLPALSRLIGLLVAAILFAAGGHRYLMAALLESFAKITPANAVFDDSLMNLLIDQLTTGISTGIRVAAPVLAATLITQILVAFISRAMPQINVLAVGLNLNALVVLVVTAITVGTLGLVFQDELRNATEQIHALW